MVTDSRKVACPADCNGAIRTSKSPGAKRLVFLLLKLPNSQLRIFGRGYTTDKWCNK